MGDFKVSPRALKETALQPPKFQPRKSQDRGHHAIHSIRERLLQNLNYKLHVDLKDRSWTELTGGKRQRIILLDELESINVYDLDLQELIEIDRAVDAELYGRVSRAELDKIKTLVTQHIERLKTANSIEAVIHFMNADFENPNKPIKMLHKKDLFISARQGPEFDTFMNNRDVNALIESGNAKLIAGVLLEWVRQDAFSDEELLLPIIDSCFVSGELVESKAREARAKVYQAKPYLKELFALLNKTARLSRVNLMDSEKLARWISPDLFKSKEVKVGSEMSENRIYFLRWMILQDSGDAGQKNISLF
jgi:hypothetical protein